MRALTRWGDPGSTKKFASQYGEVIWREWLKLEQERLLAGGVLSEIQTHKTTHFTALFRARGRRP
jgi:hypothetical protein